MGIEGASGSAVVCRKCGGEAECVERIDHPKGGPRIEVYRCGGAGDAGCGIKAVLMYESVSGEVSDEERTWVEREVARRGSFFPTDAAPGGGRFR